MVDWLFGVMLRISVSEKKKKTSSKTDPIYVIKLYWKSEAYI